MSPSYIAVIADAIASRALAPRARARLQTGLRAAVAALNRRHRSALAARCALTAGDELQCLLHDARGIWDIAHQVRHAFPEVDWIVACGRGTITTPLTPGITAPEVDGPCFHAARTALADAKHNRRVFAFAAFSPEIDGWASYYSALYWSWTRTQREAAAQWRLGAGFAGGLPGSLRRELQRTQALREPSGWSHLRRRMAWPLVAAGDRLFRSALAEAS